MEIVINKKTYILKSVNMERRLLFSDYVLPLLKDTELTSKEYLQLSENIFFVLWSFIKDEDKKEIGIKENIKDIETSELGKFTNWVSSKIIEYCNFMKLQIENDEGRVEKTERVYAFLSKTFGWTFEYIRELDEVEFMKALEEACMIQKRENVTKVNIGALTGAFASGSKEAKRKIDEINRDMKFDEQIERMRTTKIEKKGEFLTDEQLKRL